MERIGLGDLIDFESQRLGTYDFHKVSSVGQRKVGAEVTHIVASSPIFSPGHWLTKGQIIYNGRLGFAGSFIPICYLSLSQYGQR